MNYNNCFVNVLNKVQNMGGIWLKITRLILSVIVIILALTVMITDASTSTSITPYMLLGLGILNIFNGAYLYKENKKTDAIMIFSVGLFVIIVALLKFV